MKRRGAEATSDEQRECCTQAANGTPWGHTHAPIRFISASYLWPTALTTCGNEKRPFHPDRIASFPDTRPNAPKAWACQRHRVRVLGSLEATVGYRWPRLRRRDPTYHTNVLQSRYEGKSVFTSP